MNYPLIEKWLGLKVKIYRFDNLKTIIDYAYISPDELEAKLAEGFEVYGYYDKNGAYHAGTTYTQNADTHKALAIGKQPIKKKTKEEEALEFIERIAMDCYHLPNNSDIVEKAKKILEMK